MQHRVLVRARNLATFRRALIERATGGSPLDARARALIVPTRAAGELLRQAIEQQALATGRPGFVCPDLITRDDWLERLSRSVSGGRRWITRLEREVVLDRAARRVLETRGFRDPPFHLRPGLVGAMLDFYDELRRRQRSVRRLVRVLFDELRVERGTDRGSESLIDQARFLGLTFLAYDRFVRASGAMDEHGLQRALLAEAGRSPVKHLIVAVADHPADPRGLWPADFDLLGRLAGLDRIEVVVTDEAHDAGFRDRIEQELPGIEEVRAADLPWAPRLEAPAGRMGQPVFVSRDREEELRDVVRVLAARSGTAGTPLPPTAVVFHRPLPYLYLAQQVMTDAEVPYQAFDALPLAGEPFASMVDLLLTVVRMEASGPSVLAVIGSPVAAVVLDDGQTATAADAAALSRLVGDRAATSDGRALVPAVDAALATARGRTKHLAEPARRAARAAMVVAAFADRFSAASTNAGAVAELATFLRTHALTTAAGHEEDRLARARSAVLSILGQLAAHLSRHPTERRPTEAIAAMVRHAVEAHTVAPDRPRTGGVQLVDAITARFGAFDDVFLVGLVETDWSDRPRRNVFFPTSLLQALGWPQDVDRVRAQQAAFRDVLTLARVRTRLSAFELDGDTLVGLSTMIGAAADLPSDEVEPPPRRLIFSDERLVAADRLLHVPAALGPWLAARDARPALGSPVYAGAVAPRDPGVYRVSRVDRYVTCPFKYFAEDVLQLAEDRPVTAGLDPLERGSLLHAIFEDFYLQWQASGQGGITAENLQEAEAQFREAVDRAVSTLPEADRVIERLRLVGSIVAPGVADRVFDLEIAAGRVVSRRLIEVPLAGDFRFPFRHGLGEKTIAIRGKADRIDVLADGALVVVDYKLGRMPELGTSVQIGVYAHCARQQLEAADGRPHPVAAAAYLAFGDERQLEGRLGKTPADVEFEVATRAAGFASAVEQIEAGRFPPRPIKPAECQWCGYAAVCRKEYRLEDADETTEPV